MFYYHVWVRSPQYRGHEPLTYHCDTKLLPGTIVEVPLRQDMVLGFIVRSVTKPSFATKPLSSPFTLPSLPQTTLSLADWLKDYYPSPIGVITQQFLPRKLGLVGLDGKELEQGPYNALDLPPLTPEQETGLRAMQQPETYLLHGRTGSGKTRIYTELARHSIDRQRSVLVLSPEIGLTSQLAANFEALFAKQVVVLHSQLSPKERQAAWLRILHSSSPVILVGPRSALFSPLANIGLIIVDESHDSAYKQEQPPYYQSVRVASQLRQLHSTILVLGSATPTVTDYYLAVEKKKPIIRLENLAVTSKAKRKIQIVDLKDRSLFSTYPHLSRPLIEAVAGSLGKGEQSMLYLNRRGTARVVFCQICGWMSTCPHCDIPLTYLGDRHNLSCHTCAFSTTPLLSCPSCGNPSIEFRSAGTKAIVDEAQRAFPDARIMRFDTDNPKSERLEIQYQKILHGDVDILIGTQMLAKGLDLPRLSTLGIITADSSLSLPDFTARERTFQLIAQVVGRIGRGHRNTHAVIQTYHPDSQLLRSALQDSWQDFYNEELKERQTYLFPPFCYLLKLTCRRSSSKLSEKFAQSLKDKISSLNLAVRIEGPAPAFHEKVAGKFLWQLVVKARNRDNLLKIVKSLPPSGWSYDIDPTDLL